MIILMSLSPSTPLRQARNYCQAELKMNYYRREDIAVSLSDFMDTLHIKEDTRHLIRADEVSHILKAKGFPILWKEMIHHLNLDNHCDFNRILGTHTLALREEFCDEQGAVQLVSYCERENIIIPESNIFHVFHEKSIVSLFQKHGIKQCTIKDEFGSESVSLPVSKLDSVNDWFSLFHFWPYQVLAQDCSVLFELIWDQYFMLIFLKDRDRFKNDIEKRFEGFWANEKTTLFWFREAPIKLAS